MGQGVCQLEISEKWRDSNDLAEAVHSRGRLELVYNVAIRTQLRAVSAVLIARIQKFVPVN
jgi:hypothetical protein